MKSITVILYCHLIVTLNFDSETINCTLNVMCKLLVDLLREENNNNT